MAEDHTELGGEESASNPGIFRRIAEAAAGRAGATVVEKEDLDLLEAESADRRILRKELDALAWQSLDYMGGNEQDLQAVKRRKLVQQARVAWQQDAQLGAAVDLMNNFCLGRGVPAPKARDAAVQEIIDEAWNDEDNQLILTSYAAQLALGTDLSLQSNLFILIFTGLDGKVKLGMLDHDSVENVVRDPDNRRRILYYVSRRKHIKWDWANDCPAFEQDMQKVNDNQVLYYQHWANEPPPGEKCPAHKLGKGKVYHVALNRGGEMAFGHPRMHRVLRWANAFNSLMEARVDAAKAQAAFIMKRKVKGTPSQVRKLATQVLSKSGELGRSTDDGSGYLSGPRGGSILNENEGVEHESFNLDSGSAGANVDGQMIRSQISAGSGFPQHYLGDVGNANLATACHDDQTETLTDEGWMGLGELKQRAATGSLPRVAAFDPGTETIRYHAPKDDRLHLYPYEGKMARFSGRGSDMLVTPNHRMLVRPGDSARKLQDWTKVEAQNLGKRRVYERKAARMSAGVRVENFVLPGVPIMQGTRNGGTRLMTEREPQTIPMDAWLRWLGWYISEGSGDAEVAQSADSPRLVEMQEACEALGVPGIARWKGRPEKRMWTWRPKNPKQYREWLEANVGVGALNKRIPDFVFNLAADQQESLLAGLMGGDGLNRPLDDPGYTAFFTSSDRLADDFQRLALHCGYRVTKRTFERRGSRPEHVVGMTRGKVGRLQRDATYTVLPKAEWVDYAGEVYCFSTPDDTMITRRGGKVAFHCNTSMELPVLKSVESMQEVYEQMFRWFIDQVIHTALEGGRLTEELDDEEWAAKQTDLEKEGALNPGATGQEGMTQPTGTPMPAMAGMTEAALALGDPIGAMTGDPDRRRDLSYDFGLPNPLRRMMGDLVNAVSTIARTFDPNGTNMELSRSLLAVALGEVLEIEDPGQVVQKVFPPGYKDPAMAALQAQQQMPPEGGTDGAGGFSMGGSPPTEEKPANAPQPSTGSPPPEQAMP